MYLLNYLVRIIEIENIKKKLLDVEDKTKNKTAFLYSRGER